MVWPASDVDTTDMDAGTDSPATARADLLDLTQKFNQLRNHVSTLMQTVLNVGAYTPTVSVAYAATLALDAAASNIHEVAALTGNVTTINISNFAAGRILNIRFIQDGTGGRTVAAPGNVQGVINSAAGKVSWLTLIGSSYGGNHWEGFWSTLP